MSSGAPRVVVVTRATEYELLVARHATRSQAKFFLEQRGQHIEQLEERHRLQQAAVDEVLRSVPLEWRRNRVDRSELDRFLFEPDDTIVVVGQDGLVANVAKYLGGRQPVLGVNPDPRSYDGILVPLPASAVRNLLVPASQRRVETESRTMVQAVLDDGQLLVALNEIFVGHRSHQTARYRISSAGASERHASSGVVVSTGTGATGWARSIHESRACSLRLPRPSERSLAFFVREAFPSVSTQTQLVQGHVDGTHELELVSELNSGGIVFGDGLESDHLVFDWGMRLSVSVASQTLELVRG